MMARSLEAVEREREREREKQLEIVALLFNSLTHTALYNVVAFSCPKHNKDKANGILNEVSCLSCSA